MTKQPPRPLRPVHLTELRHVQGGNDKKPEKQDYLKVELKTVLISS